MAREIPHQRCSEAHCVLLYTAACQKVLPLEPHPLQPVESCTDGGKTRCGVERAVGLTRAHAAKCVPYRFVHLSAERRGLQAQSVEHAGIGVSYSHIH
jgi:hypothetical protein